MRSANRVTRCVAFGGAVLLAVAAASCGSGGGQGSGPTLPTTSPDGRPTLTTEAPSTTASGGVTTRPTSPLAPTTAVTPTSAVGPTSPIAPTSTADSTTTTTEATTTTVAPTTTATTAAPPTTSSPTIAPTTAPVTTGAPTTTGSTTTTTATVPTTVAPGGDASTSSPWIWLAGLAVLAAIALAVALLLRSRAAARAQWLSSGRDVALRSENLARRLDDAAVALTGPVGVDRQVWLDSGQTMTTLATSATTLAPDAPKVPNDPPETNSLTTGLEQLSTDLTVCQRVAADAERTRFELVGPTAEQLEFASQSVRQACAAIIATTHSLTTGFDRVDPPPAPGTTPPRS